MATVTIPLTQGKEAMIDEADYTLVSQYRWCAIYGRHTFYARRNARQSDGTFRPLAMHSLIMNPPADMVVNHIDGDGLNNTRANLEVVTKGDNNRRRVRMRGQQVPLPKTEREGWQTMQARYGNRIPLGSFTHPGLFAIVDAEDYERVAQYNWSAVPDGERFYAIRRARDAAGKWMKISLHRFIMDATPDEIVDHINGDGLDNRKSELRKCTNAENAKNQRRRSSNTSGYKGVSYRRDRGDWAAYICVNGKQMHLGFHLTAEDAARTYNAKASEMHGAFARLNIVNDLNSMAGSA